jgi:hypothetical protein
MIIGRSSMTFCTRTMRRSQSRPGKLPTTPTAKQPTIRSAEPRPLGRSFLRSSMNFLFGQHAEFLPTYGATKFVFDFDFFVASF